MTKEDLEQIRAIINEEVKPLKDDIIEMKKDIGNMKKDISNIKEDIEVMKNDIEEIKIEAKITREVTNEIGKWVELNATPNNPYPTDKTAV